MGIHCYSRQVDFATDYRVSIPSNVHRDDRIFVSSKNEKRNSVFEKVSVATIIHYWGYYLCTLVVLLSIYQGIQFGLIGFNLPWNRTYVHPMARSPDGSIKKVHLDQSNYFYCSLGRYLFDSTG